MRNCFIVLCCYLGCFSEFSVVPVATRMRAAVSRRYNIMQCLTIHLDNGIVKRRGRGRLVRFFCSRGFMLAGEKHSTCTRGKWDPAPPKCVRPTCKPISQQPSNLLIYPTHSGAVQHFFCRAGNVLNGPRDIFCNGTKWDNNIPTCTPVNDKPKLSCDFEDANLCGWTHDLNHDFDWRRENFNTPSGSIGTGPSFDHTKGMEQDGHYMYIESSSRAENDTARLISPVYERTTDDVCFEFFYHMFGATIGTLRAYLRQINESWELHPDDAFFVKSGNQRDRWYRSLTNLGTIDTEFQIVIEGIRGNGYVSDIAIDDVKIIPDCQYDEDSTTTMDSSTYNEVIPTVDTCNSRCGEKEPTVKDNYHLTCDCDDDCFNNNRCCPDYFDTCASATTDTDLETTLAEGIEEITTENYFFTHKSPLTMVHTTSPSPTTKKIVAPKTTPPLFFFETTTHSLPNTKFIAKTQSVPRFTRPVIYLKTPPPTPTIQRKFISTTPNATTIAALKPSPIKTTHVFRKETTTVSVFYEKENAINDVIDVPKPTNIDEGSYDTNSGSKEYWSDELENSLDSPTWKNFSETNKLFSQVSVPETNSHFVMITAGVCAAVLLITIVVFVGARKYRFSRRAIHSSNGESQSDVRYLKNSDELDLTLHDDYKD